jgi:hypothetical protein
MGKPKGSFSFGPPKVDHLKPEKYKGYLTISEVARRVNRDVSRIKHLERQDRIPKAVRHKVGKLEIRLYSPAAVAEIEEIFKTLKPGRPKK